MKVVYIPINTVQQVFGPIHQWQLDESYNNIIPGTYVHCEHGQDRTGLMVANYRIKNGMSKKDAEKEMLDDGFHKSLLGLWEAFEHLK